MRILLLCLLASMVFAPIGLHAHGYEFEETSHEEEDCIACVLQSVSDASEVVPSSLNISSGSSPATPPRREINQVDSPCDAFSPRAPPFRLPFSLF